MAWSLRPQCFDAWISFALMLLHRIRPKLSLVFKSVRAVVLHVYYFR